MPIAYVEAVDPIALHLKLVDANCTVCCDNDRHDIPACILDRFGEALVTGDAVRRLYVTLGQFSIIRLERDTQLLIPAYDYCVPEKECAGGSCSDEPLRDILPDPLPCRGVLPLERMRYDKLK